MKKRPIGIFDSGIGGLTVLKEVEKILPQENIIYFGDTARVPYGVKSEETILKFSIQNSLFLLKNNVKMIIIACNTSSAIALNYLKKVFKLPILGVISPGARKAVALSKNKRIGIIGTSSTINSRAYEKEIKSIDGKCRVYSKSCPLFVPLAEEGLANSKIAFLSAQHYLNSLKGKIDTLVLGCTHYPLLKGTIKKVVGPVNLVDSAYEVAKIARQTLLKNNLASNLPKKGFRKFYVSDEPDNFSRLAQIFLGKKKIKPEVVNV